MAEPSQDPIARLNAALEGRYRIEGKIGEGGMATVYSAEDLRHERKVALKVLKPELAAVVGAERFLAEIKTTANLQHPHILPLHDSGEADGFLFFVMPYVEGDTLRDKIDREKQLSVDEALKITEKVASALDYAHQQGVVHRDIKPGNILLSSMGEPTVADFGIALAVAQAGGGRVTETGLSVGTPHYMSPEQATGDRDVDPRTDVYALGCVLYEMLTGEPPYRGATAQAVLAKILTSDVPTPTDVRVSIRPNVDAAIRRALEKLPADRFATAQEFTRALADPVFRHGEVNEEASRGRGLWNPLSTAAVAAALVLGMATVWSVMRPGPDSRISRLALSAPGVELIPNGMDVSPDGSTVVFVGFSGGASQLWLRPLDGLEAEPVPGTESGRSPRFSPDGNSIAYLDYSSSQLRVASLAGGPPQSLTSVGYSGLSWDSEGFIYFGRDGGAIWRVHSLGGEPEQVTPTVQGEAYYDADVLPGGRGIVFDRAAGGSDSIAVFSFETGEVRSLFPGWTARYSRSGHILHTSAEGALFATPFDVDRLEVTRATRPLASTVWTDGSQASQFALSGEGSFVYLPGGGGTSGTELVWVSRTGVPTPVDPGWQFITPIGNYGWSLSPDGSRVAVMHIVDGTPDIWIKDLPSGPFEPVTFDDDRESYPAWTPDGEFVTYVKGPDGVPGVIDAWTVRADGTGEPELLLDDEQNLYQPLWADNQWVVFRTPWWGNLGESAGANDILGFRPGVDTAAFPLIASPEFQERGHAPSPDAAWLAYASNRTGREEVYVVPFPEVESAAPVRVSLEGGSNPIWARNRAELFFLEENRRRLMKAEFETDPEFRVVDIEPLFTLGAQYIIGDGGDDLYDIGLDDEAFLMARPSGMASGGAPQFIVVQNFFEALSQVVPD